MSSHSFRSLKTSAFLYTFRICVSVFTQKVVVVLVTVALSLDAGQSGESDLIRNIRDKYP